MWPSNTCDGHYCAAWHASAGTGATISPLSKPASICQHRSRRCGDCALRRSEVAPLMSVEDQEQTP